MNFRTTFGRLTITVGLAAGLLGGGMALVGMQTKPAEAPFAFNAAGALVRPEGYREWVIVGTPLTPNDLWSTVYKHLDIDQNATITDYSGRPQLLLPFGEPIRELM